LTTSRAALRLPMPVQPGDNRMREINVAMIGEGFMGRAHSNAWSQVTRFCKPPVRPIMNTVCGRSGKSSNFFTQWGWAHASSSWETAVKSPEIDLVDIVTPNNMHAEMALAALQAGKHVACEKPIASTLADARTMVKAAENARVKTFVWYNYRRCPAVALAHKLAKDGALGTIRHVRAFYLQDWADESIPLIWRFQKEGAGSGSHGDLNAHIIDMTRFVTGEEITEICGAVAETFVKQRQRMSGAAAGGIAAGVQTGEGAGPVTVDDAVLFLARFSGGALASFEAARQATGNQNRNGFEINGSKGSLKFNFERMNELQYYDATRPRAVQGWTTIMCTHGGDHPYAEHWWPDAHTLGYEHGFINQAHDILLVLDGREPTVPIPDFHDAFQTQRVLEAVMVSAGEHRPVALSEVK
jgi:predicted dehydrogenase